MTPTSLPEEIKELQALTQLRVGAAGQGGAASSSHAKLGGPAGAPLRGVEPTAAEHSLSAAKACDGPAHDRGLSLSLSLPKSYRRVLLAYLALEACGGFGGLLSTWAHPEQGRSGRRPGPAKSSEQVSSGIPLRSGCTGPGFVPTATNSARTQLLRDPSRPETRPTPNLERPVSECEIPHDALPDFGMLVALDDRPPDQASISNHRVAPLPPAFRNATPSRCFRLLLPFSVRVLQGGLRRNKDAGCPLA